MCQTGRVSGPSATNPRTQKTCWRSCKCLISSRPIQNSNQSKRSQQPPATYTACVEDTFAPRSEVMVGREVRAKYRGNWINGTVTGARTKKGVKRWKIEFEDNYSRICNKRQLSKWLVPPKRTYKQIDYIIVSNRFLSSVVSCRTHWAPSMHRSQWSIREDHALVACSWKWRVKSIDIPEKPDNSALISKSSGDGPTLRPKNSTGCSEQKWHQGSQRKCTQLWKTSMQKTTS